MKPKRVLSAIQIRRSLSQSPLSMILDIYIYCVYLYLQLAMSSHENATPIRVLHNSAAHLGGYARCLGAILMGYLGRHEHYFVLDTAKLY